MLLHNHKLNPEVRHKESDKESADNQFEGHPDYMSQSSITTVGTERLWMWKAPGTETRPSGGKDRFTAEKMEAAPLLLDPGGSCSWHSCSLDERTQWKSKFVRADENNCLCCTADTGQGPDSFKLWLFTQKTNHAVAESSSKDLVLQVEMIWAGDL